MISNLGSETLKTGETLDISVVNAPDTDSAAAIKRLLVHKGGEWTVHINMALEGRTGDLETRFYLGSMGGSTVANVMTVEYRGVGILGHVFTQTRFRRRGICQAIMRRVMADFGARQGNTLLLSTGYDSPPYWIYHSFGFRSLHRGFMRYNRDPERPIDEEWFAPDSARVVPLDWRHWPTLALLGAQPGGELLRSAAWKLFGMGRLEGPVVRTLAAQAQGDGTTGVALQSERGAAVGCAAVHPSGSGTNGWPGVWLLDVFAHPNFPAGYGEMLDALEYPAGKLIAYVDTRAQAKAAALEKQGFAREGTLHEFLRKEGATFDVWLYGKTAG